MIRVAKFESSSKQLHFGISVEKKKDREEPVDISVTNLFTVALSRLLSKFYASVTLPLRLFFYDVDSEMTILKPKGKLTDRLFYTVESSKDSVAVIEKCTARKHRTRGM